MDCSPSVVHYPSYDLNVYLMLDDFGQRLGRAWRETNGESADRQTLITALIDGKYPNPAHVTTFNTAVGWSRNVRRELADEIVDQRAAEGFDVPRRWRTSLSGMPSGRARQLPLPLRRSS